MFVGNSDSESGDARCKLHTKLLSLLQIQIELRNIRQFYELYNLSAKWFATASSIREFLSTMIQVASIQLDVVQWTHLQTHRHSFKAAWKRLLSNTTDFWSRSSNRMSLPYGQRVRRSESDGQHSDSWHSSIVGFPEFDE